MFSFTVSLSMLITLVSRSFSTTAPTIMTAYGPVGGSVTKLSTNKTVKSYLGIPFAKAERFEYPIPPDKWTSTLHANETSTVCPQTIQAHSEHLRHLISEDCLQLNVYIPENASSSSGLAVMMWIHGGAFSVGDTRAYYGGVLATEGNVIVVTVGYRIGALGFLSSSSDDLRGNYGMMDQIEAMKWINKNIARFGGDPSKVTIFGESAGGMSVGLLMLSPLTNGLYQNVIMQSGTALVLASHLERHEADLRARSFAQFLGCDYSSLKACAKTKTVEQILKAQLIFSKPNFLPFPPVVDGYFLPDSPVKLLQAGKFNTSNAIVGVTRDDGNILFSEIPGVTKGETFSNGISKELFKEKIAERVWIRNQNTHITDLLTFQYTDWSNATDPYVLRQQFLDLCTDHAFKAPAIKSADFLVKKKVPTYIYQLETAPKIALIPTPEWVGVWHLADIPYTFGFPLLWHKNNTSDREIKFTKSFMTLWSNFAKTGNPNSPSPLETTWPRYTADREEYIGLSPNFTVRSKMRREKMVLWNEFIPSLLTVEPTTASHMPTTTDASDNKDKSVITFAILSGVLGAVAVILLVLLIVTCRKLKDSKGREFEEEPLNMQLTRPKSESKD